MEKIKKKSQKRQYHLTAPSSSSSFFGCRLVSLVTCNPRSVLHASRREAVTSVSFNLFLFRFQYNNLKNQVNLLIWHLCVVQCNPTTDGVVILSEKQRPFWIMEYKMVGWLETWLFRLVRNSFFVYSVKFLDKCV